MPCYSDAASASKVWADEYRGVQPSWVFALLVSITTEVCATPSRPGTDASKASGVTGIIEKHLTRRRRAIRLTLRAIAHEVAHAGSIGS